MRFPRKVPFNKLVIVVVSLYAVVWINLEGQIWQATALSLGIVVLGLLYLFRRFMGGHFLPTILAILLMGLIGLVGGLLTGLLTFVLMAIKSGLHAHGPEFTQAEVSWVLSHIPQWAVAGSLTGLGVAFLLVGFRNE